MASMMVMTGSWAPIGAVSLAVVASSNGDFFVNGDVPPPTTRAPPPTTSAAPPAAGVLETAPPPGVLFGGESPHDDWPSVVDRCQTLPGSWSDDNVDRAILLDIPHLPVAAENWGGNIALPPTLPDAAVAFAVGATIISLLPPTTGTGDNDAATLLCPLFLSPPCLVVAAATPCPFCPLATTTTDDDTVTTLCPLFPPSLVAAATPAPSAASSLHFLQAYAPYAQIASLCLLAHP